MGTWLVKESNAGIVQTFYHRLFIDNFWSATGYQPYVIYDSCYQFCSYWQFCYSGFYMPVVYVRCVWWLGSYICYLCSFGFTVGSLLLLHAGCVYCSSILFMSAVLWLSIWSFLVDSVCHNRNIWFSAGWKIDWENM